MLYRIVHEKSNSMGKPIYIANQQLLRDGSPFITIGPSLISCFHVHVRLSVTYKDSVWGVWQLDAIYHQFQMQVLLMVSAADICCLCLSAPPLAKCSYFSALTAFTPKVSYIPPPGSGSRTHNPGLANHIPIRCLHHWPRDGHGRLVDCIS